MTNNFTLLNVLHHSSNCDSIKISLSTHFRGELIIFNERLAHQFQGKGHQIKFINELYRIKVCKKHIEFLFPRYFS